MPPHVCVHAGVLPSVGPVSISRWPLPPSGPLSVGPSVLGPASPGNAQSSHVPWRSCLSLPGPLGCCSLYQEQQGAVHRLLRGVVTWFSSVPVASDTRSSSPCFSPCSDSKGSFQGGLCTSESSSHSSRPLPGSQGAPGLRLCGQPPHPFSVMGLPL